MKIRKLILGTAQFGLDYGISHKTFHSKKVDYNEINNIIKSSSDVGINTIDTSSSYGSSEDVLGKIGVDKFDITTKFVADSKNQLLDQLKNSLNKLKINKIYGYISHNPTQVFNNLRLWDLLLDYKNKGLIKKIGFSINSIQDFENINKFKINPDIIQFPYNIFDNRFIEEALKLKKNGTELHSRSVFLQGLFFMNPKKIPSNINDLKLNLIELNNLCITYKLSISDIALNFALNNNQIDKVVIGIRNTSDLKKNIQSVLKTIPLKLYNDLSEINIKNKSLLDPVNWLN